MPNDRRILRFASVAIVLGLALTGCKAKYPACEADRDCKDKEFCVDRKCQQCRNSWDCGHGFACDAGSCSPIHCTKDLSAGIALGVSRSRTHHCCRLVWSIDPEKEMS